MTWLGQPPIVAPLGSVGEPSLDLSQDGGAFCGDLFAPWSWFRSGRELPFDLQYMLGLRQQRPHAQQDACGPSRTELSRGEICKYLLRLGQLLGWEVPRVASVFSLGINSGFQLLDDVISRPNDTLKRGHGRHFMRESFQPNQLGRHKDRHYRENGLDPRGQSLVVLDPSKRMAWGQEAYGQDHARRANGPAQNALQPHLHRTGIAGVARLDQGPEAFA